MAVIKDEFVLIDQFTSVFERFLNLGNQAEQQLQSIASANIEMENTFSNASNLGSAFSASLDHSVGATNAMSDAFQNAASSATAQASSLTSASSEIASVFQDTANTIVNQSSTISSANTETEESISKILASADEFCASVRGSIDYTDYWTKSLMEFEKQALLNDHSIKELIEQNYLYADVLYALEEANTKASQATKTGTEEQQKLATELRENATNAILQTREALGQSITEYDQYVSKLQQVEQQMNKISQKLESANLSYQLLNETTGVASKETMNQGKKVDELTQQLQQLFSMQKEVSEVLKEYEESNKRASHAVDELAEANIRATDATRNSTEEQQRLTTELGENATNAILQAREALGQNISEYDQYVSKLQLVEQQINTTTQKLDVANLSYQLLAEATGVASEETMNQGQKVDELTQHLKQLLRIQSETSDAMKEFEENNKQASNAVEESNNKAEKAANGGFDKLLKKVTALIATYVSFSSLVKLVGSAMQEQTYEIRFQARLGSEEFGTAAMEWVRNTANDLGRVTGEVAEATNKFMSLTTKPQNLQALTDVTDKLANFTKENDFSSMANSIQQTMRTGNVRGLSSATGISKNILEEYGVDKAAQSGNVEKFVESLNKAAAAVGITDKAYSKMMDSTQNKWNKFVNNIKNLASKAASQFLNSFGPAFDKFNEWVSSDKAISFFNGLVVVMQIVGTVAGFLTNILIGLANFIADNFSTIIGVAAVLLTIFAIKMAVVAVSTMIANLPLIAFIGLIVAAIMIAQEMGVSMEEIFSFIGGLIGGVVATIYNIFVELWNLIASIAENLASIFDDLVGSIVRIFVSMADFVLGVLEKLAKAIDFVFGSNISKAISGWRDDMNTWAEDNFGGPSVHISRLEEMDLEDTINTWSKEAGNLGKALDEFDINSLDPFGTQTGPLEVNFGDYVGIDSVGTVDKIKDNKVSLADEDLKMFAELAERKYVANINVTQLTPSISVQATNYNGQKLNEDTIAKSIQIILEKQVASHTNYNAKY